jgi:hypothetical protein
VRLRAAAGGPATVTITGPCNLGSSVSVDAQASVGAPALALGGLTVLIAMLGLAGVRALRRRAPAR